MIDICLNVPLCSVSSLDRSPFYSHISTSLQGLTTIRAYRAENRFKNQYDVYQDEHTAAWFLFMTGSRWLGARLDFICTVFIASAAFSPLFLAEGGVCKWPFWPLLVGLFHQLTLPKRGVFVLVFRQTLNPPQFTERLYKPAPLRVNASRKLAKRTLYQIVFTNLKHRWGLASRSEPNFICLMHCYGISQQTSCDIKLEASESFLGLSRTVWFISITYWLTPFWIALILALIHE